MFFHELVDKNVGILYNVGVHRDVAKLVKAQDFDSCIREFESRHPCQKSTNFDRGLSIFTFSLFPFHEHQKIRKKNFRIFLFLSKCEVQMRLRMYSGIGFREWLGSMGIFIYNSLKG